MSRTAMKLNVTGLFVLAAALCAASAGVAAPTPVPAPDPGRFTPVVTPLGIGNQTTTVVVQLAADPVTVVDADAATPLTDPQKQQLRSELKSKQAPVAQGVQSLGGQVLASYQSSYDGLKVRIRANQANALSTLPGVIAVHPLQVMAPSNVHAIPLIGAPQVWDGLAGLHGEGIKIGVIDTGIDYTHADFGGPGTAAAYQTALANDTADPTLTSVCMTAALTACVGPNAPKVKGGVDLVGDAYNADPSSSSYNPVPQPDANPLDCDGHGSHVSGTAAGFGVTAAGNTYTGAYSASTVSGNSWNVGPGVAPKADLYAIKIFGCQGSTDATIDGIEWAVTHGMDVINLSLGSPFGSASDPAAEAASNAARAGVIVVASTGNGGPSPYITTSPGTSSGAISVAANDPTQAFPGANVALSTGATLQAIDANGATFSDGTTLPVKVLYSSPGVIATGCNPASYVGVGGALVVTRRLVGGCARVARAIYGQQAGAAAVVMVNNTNAFPPYDGQISSNPDTGDPYTVTIPFLGVPSSAGAALIAADGKSATLSNATIANPGYLSLASFSSFGPRSGDSWLKPDLTAPGVAIASVGMGTGNASAIMSGTSMAAPSTAGVAALVKQAHPSWRRVRYWKAAVVNTADPSQVGGYAVAGSGTGLVQALPAVQTQVVATADRDGPALNFGFAELDRDFAGRDTVTLRNFGDQPATFTVSTQLDAGSPHTLVPRASQVTVGPHDSSAVRVELDVPASTVGTTTEPGGSFHDVSGLVTFTPASGSNNGVTFRVPYYFVAQAVSHVSTALDVRPASEQGHRDCGHVECQKRGLRHRGLLLVGPVGRARPRPRLGRPSRSGSAVPRHGGQSAARLRDRDHQALVERRAERVRRPRRRRQRRESRLRRRRRRLRLAHYRDAGRHRRGRRLHPRDGRRQHQLPRRRADRQQHDDPARRHCASSATAGRRACPPRIRPSATRSRASGSPTRRPTRSPRPRSSTRSRRRSARGCSTRSCRAASRRTPSRSTRPAGRRRRHSG